MATRYERIYLRLSEKEKLRLKGLAEANDMSMSNLVRVLIQMPAESVPGSGSGSGKIVVLDKDTMARMRREMRRWGYHYNQAVHTLNALAYYMRRDEADCIDALDALGNVSRQIDEMNLGVLELRKGVSDLADYYLACI